MDCGSLAIHRSVSATKALNGLCFRLWKGPTSSRKQDLADFQMPEGTVCEDFVNNIRWKRRRRHRRHQKSAQKSCVAGQRKIVCTNIAGTSSALMADTVGSWQCPKKAEEFIYTMVIPKGVP
mmetsp:Transcript_51468/g.119981  ORF Transcript_51468/g.119981 Transcript_51468/m.119981 type:complete len:122 (+) Transcript_51468:848-1213(+)